MRDVPFFKLQGIGNDFIIIDEIDKNYRLTSQEIQHLCERRFGVGADGVILARDSYGADFRMVFYNPDGSEAEICGNGIRCLAKYLFDHKRTDKQEVVIETKSGRRVLALDTKFGRMEAATVNMGQPNFNPKIIPVAVETVDFINEPLAAGGRELRATALSLGNPHCVIFVDDLEAFPVAELGTVIEKLPLFPRRVNVEFAQVLADDLLKLQVWERGAGLTLACGTGACAAVVAAVKNGKTKRRVGVQLPGGRLDIRWAESDNVYLSGPAEEVFAGNISI